ncbi:MAG: hypothetical protein JJU11_11905 [Candidatus Sumerlaeia bacterium]|nr:hypothetical protein [Candidatus Sumerlaeia bacterium]
MNMIAPAGGRFFRISLVLSMGFFPMAATAIDGLDDHALDHALAGLQTRAEMLNNGAYFIYERENLLRVEDGADLSGNTRELVVELIQGDNLAIEILARRDPEKPDTQRARRYMAARDGVEHSYWWDMNEGGVGTNHSAPWPIAYSDRPIFAISRFSMKAMTVPRPVGYDLHEILNPRLQLTHVDDQREAQEKWLAATNPDEILQHALGLHRHSIQRVDPESFQINVTIPEREPGFVKEQPRFEIHTDGALRSIEWYSTSDPGRLKRSMTVEEYTEINGLRLPRVYTFWTCTGGNTEGTCPYESKFRVTIKEMGFLDEEEVPSAFFNFRNIFPDSTSVSTPGQPSTHAHDSGNQYRFMEMPSLLNEFYPGGFAQALVDMDYEDYPDRQRAAIDKYLSHHAGGEE